MTQSIFHNPSRQTREAPLHGRVRVPIRPGGHQARHAEDCRARDRSGQRHHTVKLAPDRQRRTRSSRHLAAFELPNGERREWTSRWARKGLGMRNPDEPHRSGVFSWRPRTLSWWIAILFTLGSALTGALAGWEATKWFRRWSWRLQASRSRESRFMPKGQRGARRGPREADDGT